MGTPKAISAKESSPCQSFQRPRRCFAFNASLSRSGSGVSAASRRATTLRYSLTTSSGTNFDARSVSASCQGILTILVAGAAFNRHAESSSMHCGPLVAHVVHVGRDIWAHDYLLRGVGSQQFLQAGSVFVLRVEPAVVILIGQDYGHPIVQPGHQFIRLTSNDRTSFRVPSHPGRARFPEVQQRQTVDPF